MEAEQLISLIEAIEQNSSGGSSWAVFLSAAAITGAAVFAWIWQRGTARRALTFQTLERQIWDRDFIEQRKVFVGFRDNHENEHLKDLAKKENDDHPKAQAIRITLNNYELMCIALDEGVLDEKIIKSYHRSTWLHDHDRMKTYIDEIQTHRVPKAYVRYATYCKKWRNKPNPEGKRWFRFF